MLEDKLHHSHAPSFSILSLALPSAVSLRGVFARSLFASSPLALFLPPFSATRCFSNTLESPVAYRVFFSLFLFLSSLFSSSSASSLHRLSLLTYRRLPVRRLQARPARCPYTHSSEFTSRFPLAHFLFFPRLNSPLQQTSPMADQRKAIGIDLGTTYSVSPARPRSSPTRVALVVRGYFPTR